MPYPSVPQRSPRRPSRSHRMARRERHGVGSTAGHATTRMATASIARLAWLAPFSAPIAARLATARAVLTTLAARPVTLARVGWLVLGALALAVYAASLPTYFAVLQAVCLGAGCVPGQVAATDAAAFAAAGVSLRTYAAVVVTTNIATALVWIGVGIVIFWRRSDDWMGLLVSLTLVLVGTTVPISQNEVTGRWPVLLLNFAAVVLLFLVFCLFPNGRFVPRWLRWLPLAYLALSATDMFPGLPLATTEWFQAVRVALLFGCIGVLGVAQIYRFRRVSTPGERAQTKWVVFGSSATIVGEFTYWVVAAIFPGLGRPSSLYDQLFSPVSVLLILCIPLSVGVAILRYRLYDINLLINRALVYGAVTTTLAGVYWASVLLLQTLVRAATQQTSPVALVVSTLVIAALFQPLRRRIQIAVDQRFYRRKYSAARALRSFGATLRNEVDLAPLAERMVDVVRETMEPRHVSLWLRAPVSVAEPDGGHRDGYGVGPGGGVGDGLGDGHAGEPGAWSVWHRAQERVPPSRAAN